MNEPKLLMISIGFFSRLFCAIAAFALASQPAFADQTTPHLYSLNKGLKLRCAEYEIGLDRPGKLEGTSRFQDGRATIVLREEGNSKPSFGIKGKFQWNAEDRSVVIKFATAKENSHDQTAVCFAYRSEITLRVDDVVLASQPVTLHKGDRTGLLRQVRHSDVSLESFRSDPLSPCRELGRTQGTLIPKQTAATMPISCTVL
jgi:hypothetical protein